MSPHFSPFLAHLLMDGLSRRASAKATLSDAASIMEPAGLAARTEVSGRTHGGPANWPAAMAAESGGKDYRFDCGSR